MIKRRSSHAKPSERACCPGTAVCNVFMILQEKWVMFVLHALLRGSIGFNELNRRSTGVSPAILKQRLVLLKKNGLVEKRVHSAMPPRTEYRLTPRGRSLARALRSIEK